MSKNKTYVAVVDDDESFARALGRLLRAAEFDVRIFLSAEEFLASTTQPPTDCLVLDMQLGGMDGVELQHRLRELGDRTPIIFVTAHDAPEVRAAAVRAGCVAYLRKPVASGALLEALAKAMATVHSKQGSSDQ